MTSEPGSATPGSGARATLFHRLKMAVLAPMPSASDSAAIKEKEGRATRARHAVRRSWRITIDAPGGEGHGVCQPKPPSGRVFRGPAVRWWDDGVRSRA